MVLTILDYSMVIVSRALIMTERMIGPRVFAASERSLRETVAIPTHAYNYQRGPPRILDERHLFS